MDKYDEITEYLRQEESDKQYRGAAWATAIGLQEVDGLYTSQYLKETAVRNIHGEITFDEAKKRINSYYENKVKQTSAGSDTEEADKVSANIAKLLVEDAFVFSPMGLISIHRRIFDGVFKHAGKIREYNISKKEWVLNGGSVIYAPATEIMPTLEYDFSEEKKFSYKGLNIDSLIEHIIRFLSGIWQIHPFQEGNTRTTAVFLIKYLRSLGFSIDNKPFAENSWFFRNALVRANVKNPGLHIEQTDTFLKLFFENLLKGTNHELKNRQMHIHYNNELSKNSSDRPSDRPSDQVLAVMNILKDCPKSREEIMAHLGLKHIPSFRKIYLKPALDANLIERTIQNQPTNPQQKYRLTNKGLSLIG